MHAPRWRGIAFVQTEQVDSISHFAIRMRLSQMDCIYCQHSYELLNGPSRSHALAGFEKDSCRKGWTVSLDGDTMLECRQVSSLDPAAYGCLRPGVEVLGPA